MREEFEKASTYSYITKKPTCNLYHMLIMYKDWCKKYKLMKPSRDILHKPRRETVKLLISAITLLVLERSPPWNASLVVCLPRLKRVVQQSRHYHRHRWW